LLLVKNTPAKDPRRRAALQEVFYTSPLTCPLTLIEAWLQERMELCARGRITAPMLMKDWIAADQALTQRQVLHPAESDEAARLQIRATGRLLESVPDCNSLQKTARQQLKDRDDPTLYQAWYVLLHLRNCSPAGLPDSLEQRVLLHNTDPRWFRIAANVSLNAGQADAALLHASQARDLELNDQMRAGDLVFISRVLAQQGRYAEARRLLEDASVLHPTWGEPYLRLADLYAGGGSSCKLSRFDQKAVYWAAIDMCLLARNVDPSTEEDANRRIFEYQKNVPTQEECSFRGLRPGDTYPLLCWMETTTTVKGQ
jgi:tetratricopeptide (TPR) repeat protein